MLFQRRFSNIFTILFLGEGEIQHQITKPARSGLHSILESTELSGDPLGRKGLAYWSVDYISFISCMGRDVNQSTITSVPYVESPISLYLYNNVQKCMNICS